MEVKDDHIQLFMLFQECTPIHFYTKTNEDLIMNDDLKNFFHDLDVVLACIQTENYKGFFDSDNINAFLANYDILDDYYLISPRKKLRQSLKSWRDWKSDRESNSADKYKISKTPTENNSFGEIHARKTNYPNNNYVIVSHDSICFCNQTVDVEQTSNGLIKQIDCVELRKELKEWIDKNRIPVRIYHASPKHGENGKGEWHGASKLLCSHIDAETMLSKAIGINGIDELYYYDKTNKSYIIFRYEGNIGENKFHAYHLSENDIIDKSIKNMLNNLIYKT